MKSYTITVNGNVYDVTVEENGVASAPVAAPKRTVAAPVAAAPAADGPVTGPTLNAPMGGTVVEIKVKPGDKVKKGQSLLMYEAMKMQNEIEADGDYTVKRILVKEGEVIAAGQPIVEFVG